MIAYRFKTLDKFIYYSSRKEMKYHPRGVAYAYSFGAEFPMDLEPYKFRDYYVAIFNTSHKKGVELHDAEGWARDVWTRND